MKRVFGTIHCYNLILPAILLIAAVSHGFNMLHYPYFENDEGTYISQAWSLLKFGKLAPYTYWYDHAPFGWMFISLWTMFTGGFFTFGLSIVSGRVFMLVLHVISTFFLYDIARRMTKQPWAGVFAALIFSLSPLAIYFQRRVLLDNMMIFWVLFSFWLLLGKKLTLIRTYISAIAFGLAILTKENAIFFFPALLYAVFHYTDKRHRIFAFVTWIAVSICLVSVYFLYAIYKNEFFPPGFLTTGGDHVSLLKTLAEQVSRGKKLPFFHPQSDFWLNAIEWMKKDSLLLISGALAALTTTGMAIRYKYFRIPALLGGMFWFFLLRGGLVIDFYIIPLIPMMALSIGLLLDWAIYYVSGHDKQSYVRLSVFMAAIIIAVYATRSIGQYSRDETTSQIQGLEWAYQNIPRDSVVAVDAFALVDWWERGFTDAHWFWKLWSDPAVVRSIDNRWDNIRYIFLTHEMVRTMESRLSEEDILREALLHSEKLAMYGPSIETYLDIDKFKSTNGDWVGLYRVTSPYEVILTASWNYYKSQFIHNWGQVIDPNGNVTTSEGQAYAMLRAVWMRDRETFDAVWTWTRQHLQYREHDKLFSWLWKNGKVEDSGTASDADVDIALALILASRVWRDDIYTSQARELLDDIWKLEVKEVRNTNVLVSSADSGRPDGYLVNPSYFSPAWYRIFATVDSSHPWEVLAEDTYIILDRIKSSDVYGKDQILPPNWVLVDSNGTIKSAEKYVSNVDSSLYGYDAFRTLFRVALDAFWYDVPEAREYLAGPADFFSEAFKNKSNFSAVYTTLGQEKSNYSDLSTSTGAFAALMVHDEETANEVYKTLYETTYREEGYWGDKTKYFDQNWSWFVTALYYKKLPNLE